MKKIADIPVAIRAEAEFQVGKAALSFINRGLSDFDGRKTTTGVKVLELLWRERCANLAGSGLATPVKKAVNAKDGWERALQEAQVRMLKPLCDGGSLHFPKMPLPQLGLAMKDGHEVETIKTLLGAQVSMPPDPAIQRKEPLSYAYRMALFNQERAAQRLTLLYHIADILRSSRDGAFSVEEAGTQFEAASSRLWLQHNMFRNHARDAAILLGGEPLRQILSAVKQSWGPGMSIVQYHSVDGAVPGRWLSSEEEAFRQAIADALGPWASVATKKPRATARKPKAS